MFAVWVGTVVDIRKQLVLVWSGKEEEAVQRLARVGYENVRGYLMGGFPNGWGRQKTDTVISVSPADFASKVNEGASVLDVRKYTEAESGHIKGANRFAFSRFKKQSFFCS